jgi:MFS family permease
MKRRTPLYSLLLASLISLTGNRLTMIALPWFVLQTTGSVAKAGITGFFSALPVVLAAFLGGPIIERLGYRRVSIIADLISGVTVALIPLLHATVGLSFWQLQALVFLGAFLDAPGETARAAVLPDLAQEADIPLERVNAASQVINQLSYLVGPIVAGLLISIIGASNVLWVDAATFVASAVLTVMGVPAAPGGHRSATHTARAPATGEAAAGPARRYLSELGEGLRFVRKDRLMFTMIAIVTLTNLLDSPIYAVLLPAYAQQVLGNAKALGLIVSLGAVGSVSGALLFGAIGPKMPRRTTYLTAWVLVSLGLWWMARLPSFPWMAAAVAFAGFAAGPLNPIITTVSQERVPLEMRGRVFGMTRALAYAATPIGPMVSGFVVEAIGIRSTLTIIAGCYLAITLAQTMSPALRGLDRASGTASASGVGGA